MDNLKLSRTHKHYRIGDKDDWVVLDGARVIGRIFRQPQAPEGRPWFWTITAPDIPPSLDKRGYSATREEAMAAFKARWLARWGWTIHAEGIFDRLGSDNTGVGLTGSNLAANRSMNMQKHIRPDPHWGKLPPS